jgi:hypothetical protein
MLYNQAVEINANGNTQDEVLLPTSRTVKFTEDGGLAILMRNWTGAASVKGLVVRLSSTGNRKVVPVIVDAPDPIGVFLDDDVENGGEAWVVVAGVAYVYFVGNTTAGNLARTFITADGAAYVTGQALAEAIPTSPFASDKHFCEMGHVVDSRTGAGLARVILHFN